MRWLMPLLGSGLALITVATLYRGLDFNRLAIEIGKAKWWWIAVLAVAILLEQFVQGWKWRQFLFKIKPISTWRLTGAFLAGYGANILMPLGISPLVRSWLVARLEGVRMATVLVTTAISRFIDGIVFAVIVGFVAAFGQIPQIEGDLRVGLAAAGTLNLLLFSAILWVLFKSRDQLQSQHSLTGRLMGALIARSRGRLDGLSDGLAAGIIWPRDMASQLNIIGASFAMKAIATTHFVWASLAVGILLEFWDYLFLMVFAGFTLVLARFIRVPGGFLIGSGLALKLLGVPNETALAMILFNHGVAIILVVGIGLTVLWQGGIDIRKLRQGAQNIGEHPDPNPTSVD